MVEARIRTRSAARGSDLNDGVIHARDARAVAADAHGPTLIGTLSRMAIGLRPLA
jgi:hypothetical protein